MEYTEGFLVITMTYNETKILRWTSSTPRSAGILWTGALDIDDYTQNLSASYMVSEATLDAGLIDHDIIQVTSSGIYISDAPCRRCGSQERIVQATVTG